MDPFETAVATLISSLGERPFDAQSVVVRDGDAIVRRVGDIVAERWDERGFVDVLLERSYARRQLGLPEPSEVLVITRALARLRAGEHFRSGGSDDGGRSGRGVAGGWQELSAEGDRFVFELVGFYEPSGGEPEYDRQRQELDEPGLRALLASNDIVRRLVGLV